MGQLYSKLKIFNYTDKIDSLAENHSTILAPIHIRIKPTNVCAHHCWYCAYRDDNLQLGKNMQLKDSIPRDKMLEILSDLIKMDVKAITFSGGGDPFYYPYLLESVKLLSSSNIDFASLTNGARLNGEIAELFARHGKWIRVSIDGWDDSSYAHYRGVKEGEFTKVMQNMQTFKKYGGQCYLGVSLIIDENNWPHLMEFSHRLKEIGVDSVKYSPCVVSNDQLQSATYHQPFFSRVKAMIEEVKSILEDRTFEVFDSYHDLSSKFDKSYEWCPYIQILPVIGADLNVYSCQDKAYNDEGLIGSIRHQRFRDFWFDDKQKFYRINPARHCQHHCVSNNANAMLHEFMRLDNKHLSFV